MKGAIFFSSKYGSTQQYSEWISEATGLSVFNIKDKQADPSKFDFLVLGCPIYYFKLQFRKWLKRNLSKIEHKPVILFTVSGAPGGKKLNAWIANSGIPMSLISKMKHVALQGRQSPAELSWFDWIMLRIGGMMNRDPKARKDELKGFDYMDRDRIQPIVNIVQKFQAHEGTICPSLTN